MQKLIFSMLVIAAATAASAKNPNVVGSQTAGDKVYHIETRSSAIPFGPHSSDKAGIGVSNAIGGVKAAVDFEGLTKSKKVTHDVVDGQKVYHLENPIPDQGNPWWKFHRDLGVFNFVQVGSGDVWIGEWAKNSGNGSNIRQAYYVGDKSGTTMPSEGTATYTTYGLNNFDGTNLMKGTLTANFGDSKLSGELTDGVRTLSLTDVKIHAATGQFGMITGNLAAGKNKATMDGVQGDVKGHFFGAQAAALAGVADFEGRKDLNTSFGGTKN